MGDLSFRVNRPREIAGARAREKGAGARAGSDSTALRVCVWLSENNVSL